MTPLRFVENLRDLEVTHTVAGQDGPLIWGTTSSANNDSKEPFAWPLSQDNKTIVGADTDGYYRIGDFVGVVAELDMPGRREVRAFEQVYDAGDRRGINIFMDQQCYSFHGVL